MPVVSVCETGYWLCGGISSGKQKQACNRPIIRLFPPTNPAIRYVIGGSVRQLWRSVSAAQHWWDMGPELPTPNPVLPGSMLRMPQGGPRPGAQTTTTVETTAGR